MTKDFAYCRGYGNRKIHAKCKTCKRLRIIGLTEMWVVEPIHPSICYGYLPKS